MTGLIKNKINLEMFYKDIFQAMRILGIYLCMYKQHYGYTWDRVASNINTTRKTLLKIRKAEKPILASTYCYIYLFLLKTNSPKPKELDKTEGTEQEKSHTDYRCHPDCPYIKDFKGSKESKDKGANSEK